MKNRSTFLKVTVALIALILILTLSSCNKDLLKDQEQTSKHEHEWGEWTIVKEASCTADGEQERVCECGEKENRKLPALEHTEVTDAAISPTCTVDGKSEGKHCSVCNNVTLKQETIPAKHSYAESGVKPTKTEDGYTTYNCSACGHTYTEKLPATGSLGLIYSLNNDKKSYSLAGLGSCTDTEIIIPKIYQNYEVTAIGKYAISSTYVTNITLPDTIKSIDELAFSNCTALAEIELPNSITKIGPSAFLGCKSLTDIKLPEGLTYIDKSVFKECAKLTKITIPEGIEKIDDEAFRGCDKLVTIIIPASTNAISSTAFSYCNDITSISISPDNKSYYTLNNCLIETNTKTLVKVYGNGTIPTDGSVTAIGAYAFHQNSKITEIIIPDGVVSIDNSAFSGCGKLKSIFIPDSVKSIGDSAFFSCISLSSLTLGNGVISLGSRLVTSTKITEIVIPTSVKEINKDIFFGLKNFNVYMCVSKDEFYKNFYFLEQDKISVFIYNENGAPDTDIKYWHYVDGVPTKW